MLCAAVFGPGLLRWTTVFLGREYVDAWGTQWFYWFVGHQIREGEGFGWSDLFFYPWGKEIYLHTGGNILDAIFALPLRWMFGPIAGYNLWILAILYLNHEGMRRLAMQVGCAAVPARIAGVLFAFNPYLLNEINGGRPTQVMLSFFLLFLSDLLATGESRRWMLPVRAGVWLALTGITYWFYAFFAGIGAVGIVAWRLLSPRPGDSRLHLVVRHGVTAVVALLIAGPFIAPMMTATDVPGLLKVDDWSSATWTPTTAEGVGVGIYAFDPVSRMAGFFVPKDGERLFLPEFVDVLAVQAVFALLGVLVAPKKWRGAAIALLAASLLVAMGPIMQVGVELPNYLYLWMVQSVTFLRRLWWPARALVVTQAALMLMVAWALHAAARRPSLLIALTVLIVSAWGFELNAAGLAPMPTWSARVPNGYRCLKGAESGAVIELPYAFDQSHLYYQTYHELPLLGGMVEDNPLFSPKEQIRFRRQNSYIRLLMSVATDDNENMRFLLSDRDKVEAVGYRYVILNKAAYGAPQLQEEARVNTSQEGRLRSVRRKLAEVLGNPVFEDVDAAVYAPFGDASPCPDLEGARTSP